MLGFDSFFVDTPAPEFRAMAKATIIGWAILGISATIGAGLVRRTPAIFLDERSHACAAFVSHTAPVPFCGLALTAVGWLLTRGWTTTIAPLTIALLILVSGALGYGALILIMLLLSLASIVLTLLLFCAVGAVVLLVLYLVFSAH